MVKVKGLVADIQRMSMHDGSGIRTTVFFKGCPLNCAWCHNPECISSEPQTLFYPEKCIHCGKCNEGCYAGARVICGRQYSINELLAEVLPDRDYYGTDGGVTFSGGEPLAQKEFLNEAIAACRKNGIKCAVETSLIYYDEEIFRKSDFVMADLKIWNSAVHKKYTGAGNENIKENFKRLDSLNIDIIARTPVIPGIDQEIDKISAFMKNLNNVVQYELLPYHPLGNYKRRALGDKERSFQIPTKEVMDRLNQYSFERKRLH